jgi:hypothetical protein
MDPTIIKRNSLNPKEKENLLASNFFKATRSPKTVSFPQFNQNLSSLIDIPSIFEENISNMIVNFNTRIIYLNFYSERYMLRAKEYNNI